MHHIQQTPLLIGSSNSVKLLLTATLNHATLDLTLKMVIQTFQHSVCIPLALELFYILNFFYHN